MILCLHIVAFLSRFVNPIGKSSSKTLLAYSYSRFILGLFEHCGQLGDKDTFLNAVLKWMYKRPYEYALNKLIGFALTRQENFFDELFTK